jgi:hypothetical protein
MKGILIVTPLIINALAFVNESAPTGYNAQRQSAKQSQSSGSSQAKVITDLPISPANRGVPPLDLTGHALKDKKGLCKVHHQTLKMVTVPIKYGLTPGPPYSPKTEEKRFPNAVVSVERGCLVMPVKEAFVLQCQKCVEAKTKWAKSKR